MQLRRLRLAVAELAYESSHGLVVLDIPTDCVVARLPIVSSSFAFSADGQRLGVAGVVPAPDGNSSVSSGIHVFRVADGMEVAFLKPPGAGYLGGVEWPPDDRFLAFMSDGDVVHLWNPGTGNAAEASIRLRSRSRSFSLSHDGKRLAVGDGEAIDVFRIGQ